MFDMADPLQNVSEGKAPFSVPAAGKPCSTWYRVYGTLNDRSKVPVIALHGGPGCGHEYMKPGIDLWTKHGIPIVLYDQIGCGASTNLPEKCGDESFWTVELFRREIDNLVAHLGLETFDLWGHSWGSMLASDYAFRQPKGLRKLILMGGLASVDLYLNAVKARIAELPQQVQDTIRHFDETGDYDAQPYKDACLVFYKRYMCRLDPWPEDVSISVKRLEDPTVYRTMFGPSELRCTGNLRGWSVIGKCNNISVPTLLINGFYDEIPESAAEPWFEEIPRVKWRILSHSSHMGQWEERAEWLKIMVTFLQ